MRGENIIALLTDKDSKSACAIAEQIAEESRENNNWYPLFESFAGLLSHENSLVRNRAMMILAANARWDNEGKFDTLIDEFLSHISDEKPITSRKCISALPEITSEKPQLKMKVCRALENADVSKYRDSMQPLLLRDIKAALETISAQTDM